ncbi:uncharacterized protein BKA55DRAFT_536074 [Fusarium redolens]|jgi:hypothetical protein|uniref:Uncharacterized protein n=1 Tax=Fusarium redolens TaxID=48865 RepID=A0A9P9HQR2_FUSRE|nr:uncharacterized protein BKA55DRAFT_536074 [Fusarium redolens]KAH7261067.1 hypothetical protein BKA55DRAFT_536074 [Fusarium redolens]
MGLDVSELALGLGLTWGAWLLGWDGKLTRGSRAMLRRARDGDGNRLDRLNVGKFSPDFHRVCLEASLLVHGLISETWLACSFSVHYRECSASLQRNLSVSSPLSVVGFPNG